MVFAEIRDHCLALEGASEEYPWEHVAWKVKGKIFAIGTEGESTFTFKNTPERQGTLILHPNIRSAAYTGRFGWITMDVPDDEGLELAKGLIDESYALLTRRPSRR